jgi:hypothetical protein
MPQNASTRSTNSPGCLGAGGPVWYVVLAISFLSCELNPVGAAGLAMRILTPHDMYSKPVGWLLTAGSYAIAMTGFIATERIAYLERQRRPLEIASLLSCGAGLLAFALGFTIPAYVMWPIATVLVLIGAYGFRGTRNLPVPGMPGTSGRDTLAVGQSIPTAAAARVARSRAEPEAPARKRRRRRRRKRPGSTPSND